MTISKQLFTFNFSKNHIDCSGRAEIVHFGSLGMAFEDMVKFYWDFS